MATLPFHKLSPGGNTTILLHGTKLSQKIQTVLAAEVLSDQHLGGEQVGFIDLDAGLLQMAGGEFCLNATRSLGLLMALRANEDTKDSWTWQGKVKVSGLDHDLPLEVCHDGEQYMVHLTLDMVSPPMPQALDPGVDLLVLPGISHLLIAESMYPFSPAWRQHAASFLEEFSLENAVAAGCIWWREGRPSAPQGRSDEDDICFLAAEPVVTVREPYTQFHERSCGSGALALALALHARIGRPVYSIMQPGGTPLTVHLTPHTQGLKATVGGPVVLVAEGLAHFRTLAH